MERAMPYRGSSLSAHRIGILMSQTGRFLEMHRVSFELYVSSWDALRRNRETVRILILAILQGPLARQ